MKRILSDVSRLVVGRRVLAEDDGSQVPRGSNSGARLCRNKKFGRDFEHGNFLTKLAPPSLVIGQTSEDASVTDWPVLLNGLDLQLRDSAAPRLTPSSLVSPNRRDMLGVVLIILDTETDFLDSCACDYELSILRAVWADGKTALN